MNTKQFERYLELVDLCHKHYDQDNTYTIGTEFEFSDELYKLKKELEKLLYNNQSTFENSICKLKNSLNNWQSLSSIGYKPNEALNEIKVIRELLYLLELYDWKLKYSEDFKNISVWEENGEGKRKNIRTWEKK